MDMNALPQQIFQNHMVHHPLLQYQMLFPSLLMSIGAPPQGRDNVEGLIDDEGKVSTMDYLRFSALANQLAITQINQVLLDLIIDTPGDDIKKLVKMQKSFKDTISNGFSQFSQEITRIKEGISTNNKQVAEFQEKLQSMESSFTSVKNTLRNIKEDFSCCKDGGRPAAPPPPPPEPPFQKEFKNLSQTLENSMTVMEVALAEISTMKTTVEECSDAASKGSMIDYETLAKSIEEIVSRSNTIHPQMNNISEDIGRVDSSLSKTQDELQVMKETLTTDLRKTENSLQTLKNLTRIMMDDLSTKMEALYNVTQMEACASDADTAQCPEGFLAIKDECFTIDTDGYVSFNEASEICRTTGSNSYLAEPQFLMKFISRIIDEGYNATGLWLGGKMRREQEESESARIREVWYWEHSDRHIEYGWNTNHPGVGECAIISGYGLSSTNCEVKGGYICQTDPL